MQVLVVGASRGIGLELVRQQRAQGHEVSATARDADALQRLAALGARPLRLDLLDAASVAGLAWQLDGAAFDRVWLNAGVFGPRSSGLQAPAQADFDLVMHTNVLGPMRLLQLLPEVLAPQARIALLSSAMGSLGARRGPDAWLYRASKAALNSLAKDASLALAGRAVCVALHPGWVRTDMGGAQAPLAVEDAVARLLRLLDGLPAEANGRFLDLDGQALPW